jgi:hypothetical protein
MILTLERVAAAAALASGWRGSSISVPAQRNEPACGANGRRSDHCGAGKPLRSKAESSIM